MYAEKGRGVSPSDLKHKHFWSVDLSQWLKGLGQIIEGCHASNNSERRQSVTLEKKKKTPTASLLLNDKWPCFLSQHFWVSTNFDKIYIKKKSEFVFLI